MAIRRMIGIAAAAALGTGLVLAAYSELRARRIEAAYPPVGRFAEAAGVRLHYVDLLPDVPDGPEAPAIVFIHGASGNLRDPLLAFRGALEGRHRLVFVDRPGHGWSDRGGDPEIAAPARQAEVIAALLKRIGVARAVVVGHSWGGSVAAALALGHPELTAGLVFVAPATHPWPGGVAWYYKAAAQPLFGSLFARTLVMPIGSASLEQGLKGVFDPNPEPEGYVEKAAVPLLFRPREFIANAEDVFRLNGYLELQAPRYGEIRVPTAILSGNRDSVVYEELHSGGLARAIAGSHLIWLPNVGHMPHHAATDTVVAAIEEVANLARGRALAMR
ncbi:alpha/beta fold hydrolase [Prosthecomicrobium sp. N25]|uniref:alpha/beta fold hydrolase n=1 Tax=Prosthecomicrobium sp. N25 TaxID=3129254 RepID=UPI003076E307